jgi:hypothetical protein
MATHESEYLLERRSRLVPDDHGDPMASMGNLFDVAVLIGVGFLIVALTGFGLGELLSSEDVTIVKAPGTSQMEIIRKQGKEIQRFSTTDSAAEGMGTAIGTVYELDDGRIVWVPNTEGQD